MTMSTTDHWQCPAISTDHMHPHSGMAEGGEDLQQDSPSQ